MRKIYFEEEKPEHYRLIVVEDCSHIYDANKELKALQGRGITKDKVWKHRARIPVAVILSLPREQQIALMTDDKALDRFIKEHPEFLVSEGT